DRGDVRSDGNGRQSETVPRQKEAAPTVSKKVGSMMDHDNRQDQALKEALKRIYEEIEIPDSTESWKRVEERLARRRSVRRWHQRLRYIAAVFVGSAVLTLAVNMKVPGAYSFEIGR